MIFFCSFQYHSYVLPGVLRHMLDNDKHLSIVSDKMQRVSNPNTS